MNETFRRRLDDLGVRYASDAYGPGTHSWGYWRRDLAETLPEMMDAFAADRPDPTSFSFRSADRSFGLYGWRVRLRTGDPGLRFTRLQVTGRRGFSLRGSGRDDRPYRADLRPGEALSDPRPRAVGEGRPGRAGRPDRAPGRARRREIDAAAADRAARRPRASRRSTRLPAMSLTERVRRWQELGEQTEFRGREIHTFSRPGDGSAAPLPARLPLQLLRLAPPARRGRRRARR